MRSVLRYPGAKWNVADWIVGMMPPHKSYLEPFFGSGAVFFEKNRAPIETVNDLDGEIVNLFRMIREQPEELAAAVAMTPYSREEYDRVWERLRRGDMDEPNGVEHARMTLLRYWQTYGSSARRKSGWKNDVAGREAAYAEDQRRPRAPAHKRRRHVERGDDCQDTGRGMDDAAMRRHSGHGERRHFAHRAGARDLRASMVDVR